MPNAQIPWGEIAALLLGLYNVGMALYRRHQRPKEMRTALLPVGQHIADLEATVNAQALKITDLEADRTRQQQEIDALRNEKGAVTIERDALHKELAQAQAQIVDLTRRVTELEIEKRIWEGKDKLWTEFLAKFTVVLPSAILPPAEVALSPLVPAVVATLVTPPPTEPSEEQKAS